MSLCNKIKKLFSAYLEGELADDQRTAFEQHLQECPGCRKDFAVFQIVCRHLKELPKPKPTPYFDAALYYRVRREQRSNSRSFAFPLSSWKPVPVFVAAAALLIFLGAQLQKSAMEKQIRELTALNDLLRQSASSNQFVVTHIDTTANRIKVIKYVNTRPAAEWAKSSYQHRGDEPVSRSSDFPDLRRAPKAAGSYYYQQTPNLNGARVIQASQYQF